MNNNLSNPEQKPSTQEKVYAEICGKVTYVNRRNRKLFKIHASQMDKDFRVLCNFFCPVIEGDAIYGLAEYVKDNRYGETLILVEEPFVILSQDKNSILQCFLTALRGTGFGNAKAFELFQMLELKCNKIANIVNTLDHMASIHNYHSKEKMLDTNYYEPYIQLISEAQMKKLLSWWYKHRVLRRLHLLGIYNREIKAARMDPNEMYKRCLEIPYTIYSLSIEKCDNIMRRIGKEPDPHIRHCANITRNMLDHMNDRAWSSTPSNYLVRSFPNITEHLDTLKDVFEVKTELHTAYLPYAYEVETGITDLVVNLIDGNTLPHALTEGELVFTRDDLSEDQKKATVKALQDNISIITGGAGCGKSTIIKEMVTNLERSGISYQVVSFTGKAVSRVREIIGKQDPMTMHMMLASKKTYDFQHLIIDEASMVTSPLFYKFVTKFDFPYRITLVGDNNQLTPIGWGCLFQSLIKSGIVPIYTLVHCHRTNTDIDNGILINAATIIEHAQEDYAGPPFEYTLTNNFNILEGDINVVRDLVLALRNCGTKNDDIMIISPYNKYLANINSSCQEIYNEDRRRIVDGRGVIWRIDDRVMMIENNYDLNVMNGDEGRVTDLTDTEILVNFKDGNKHIFQLSQELSEESLDHLEDHQKGKDITTASLIHSFAVSVHRSQGSEWDYVIIYIPEVTTGSFLNRNLMYTALTRAKKLVWLVGDYNTMARAATTPPPHRYDNLALRLSKTREIDL